MTESTHNKFSTKLNSQLLWESDHVHHVGKRKSLITHHTTWEAVYDEIIAKYQNYRQLHL